MQLFLLTCLFFFGSRESVSSDLGKHFQLFLIGQKTTLAPFKGAIFLLSPLARANLLSHAFGFVLKVKIRFLQLWGWQSDVAPSSGSNLQFNDP